MANRDQFTAQQFIDAIPGSGGIISTIASRVGCDWKTAKKYIDEKPTVKTAYECELEGQIDKAEALVLKNIENAARLAQKGVVVDTADARWFLSRKGKSRGYTERQEITGADGGAIKQEVTITDDSILRKLLPELASGNTSGETGPAE